MPPSISAFDLYLRPNILPIFTPAAEKANVIIPINVTAGIISTFKNANVTPIARASILKRIFILIFYLS